MKGKIVALSAISSSLSVILLTIGHYISVLDISCILFASIIIMLPLYKNSIKGALFCYFSTLILTFFTTGLKLSIIIPYGAFFGLHPIINEIQLKYKLNKWLFLIIKTLWFIGSLFLVYYTTTFFVDINEKYLKYIYYIIPIAGALFFIVYDAFIFLFRKRLQILLTNIGL